MRQVYKLPLVLEPQPEGGYMITCPLLPNLITEADPLEEVVPNVTDAVAALLEAYQEMNLPLPDILQPVSQKSPLLAKTLIQMEAA